MNTKTKNERNSVKNGNIRIAQRRYAENTLRVRKRNYDGSFEPVKKQQCKGIVMSNQHQRTLSYLNIFRKSLSADSRGIRF